MGKFGTEFCNVLHVESLVGQLMLRNFLVEFCGLEVYSTFNIFVRE